MRLTVLALLLLGCVSCGRPPEPTNALLVMIDSLRADHLHAYGYPRETSPTIDALARDGARFENVIAPTS